MKLYQHIKTGRLYKIVSEDLTHKDPSSGTWSQGRILYKALYPSDKTWFSREPSDFYEKFKEVTKVILLDEPDTRIIDLDFEDGQYLITLEGSYTYSIPTNCFNNLISIQ